MNIENSELTYEVANGNTLVVNLLDLNLALSRIGEIQGVTKLKAPELLSTFNKAWRDAAESIAVARVARIQAQRAADRVRAILLLDKIPTILKEKGLTSPRSPGGSEDLRQAALDIDEEYQKALEIGDKIDCVVELLRGKQKSVEMAYSSVKKILGDGDVGYSDHKYSAGGE